MAIVKMKRLRLACMRSDKDTLLERLQELGCVEIDQITANPEDPRWGNLKPVRQETAGAAREQKNAAERALGVLKRYAPEKSSFLDPKPSLTTGQLLDADSAQNAQEQTEEVNAAQHRLDAIEKVANSERQSNQQREAAMQESKQKVLNAQRAAQRLLEESRAQAEQEVKQMMSQAEQQAAGVAKQVMQQAQAECEELKHQARNRLDEAAQRIVERVVNR